MTTSIAINKATNTDAHMRVTWLLVGGLFILRIPLYGGVPLVAVEYPDWLDPVWEIGTYLLTALLIWWERDRLADFHIDKVVLLIFIAGKPLELLLYQQQIPYSTFPNSVAYFLYLPIAIGLAVALLRTRPTLPKLNVRLWGWMVIGFLGGIALAAYFASVFKVYRPRFGGEAPTSTLLVFVPLWQMLYAGLGEEPFFRGFLWGSFRKTGLKDVWIWLLQAALFWLSHLSTLLYAPFSFWLIVPVGGLVLGLLAWRSRSIAPSLLAHGLANGLSGFM